jgi:hypothetical protein
LSWDRSRQWYPRLDIHGTCKYATAAC